jgi:hypothetical protein
VTEPAKDLQLGPGFVVLREVGDGHWQVVGEVPRKPGLPARAARIQAVKDATGSPPGEGEVYAAVLRSEWRIAQQF